MSDLQKELQALKEKVAELESRILFPNEPVAKWQPKGGNWWISKFGKVQMSYHDATSSMKEFGMERQTEEQAKRAAVEMRRFNRLLALRDELCGDEVVDWESGCGKYFLTFSHRDKKWMVILDTNYEHITPYFITEEMAEHACDLLNDGEVEL